jgi:hypothetical protein
MLPHLPSGTDLPAERWLRSSYSTGANNCVEMAVFGTGVLAVRDSKNPEGPALIFKATAWSAFLEGVRGGEFGAP